MSTMKVNTLETVDGTHSVEVANLGGLGLTGETWVNETANREIDVEYTNDTGKPIVVLFRVSNSLASGWVEASIYDLTVSSASLVVQSAVGVSDMYPRATAQAIIPVGHTYKYHYQGSDAIVEKVIMELK